MTVHSRLRRLEAQLAGISFPPPPCPTCGFPRSESLLLVVVDHDKGEALGTCPRCGSTTGPDGRSIGRVLADGRVHLHAIILEGRETGAPPLPIGDRIHSTDLRRG